MGVLIDFKTGKPVAAPPRPNRLAPNIDKLLRRYYETPGEAGQLARTVVQLLDTLDLVCMTAECSAIDLGVHGQPNHPYSVMVEMCRDILDSEQLGYYV